MLKIILIVLLVVAVVIALPYLYMFLTAWVF